MNCQLINEHVVDYLDESLDKDITKEFNRHLSECKSCEALVNNVKLTYKLLDQPITIQASEDFVDKTIVRLNKPEAKIISIFYNVLKPIAVAASIGLGILIGNGESTILENNDSYIGTEVTSIGLASPTEYSVWQSLNNSYGNQD